MNDIEISNIALIHCGIVDTISSFEDASEEAGVISTVFDTVKLSMLAEYPWNFAVEWSNLSPLVEVPGNPDFEYQFQLILINENNLCSILFHLLVPGGKYIEENN